MTALPVAALPAGLLINGRYEVIRHLGTGGQGAVYEVGDHFTGETSALKFLNSTVTPGVWREAQILAAVRGEYLLPVRNADLVSGTAILVTEVAEHGTTQDHLANGVGVPTALAVTWVRQASRGIARLHDLRLVHNDIKPANLFLDARGDVVVGDVGYATLLDASGHAAPFGGTASTTAPEVAAAVLGMPGSVATPASVRSDVFGLGATAYWLLTGQPPYSGATRDDILRAVVAGPPALDLLDAAPHVTQGVRDVVRRAMSLDPADRFSSPAEIDHALGRQPTQRRTWTQVVAHPGHTACFVGVRGQSALSVCALPTGPRGRHTVEVRHHDSGRRTAQPWKVCTQARLAQALRAVFRENP